MTPGDPSIRKLFDRICPREGGEQVPAWLSRVARTLGWPAARVTSLYKDSRCRLSDAEGQLLRAYERGDIKPGVSARTFHNQSRLRGALARDEELNGFIKETVNEQTTAVLRHFAESLLEALPRDCR